VQEEAALRGPDPTSRRIERRRCALRAAASSKQRAARPSSGDDARPGVLRGLRTEGLPFAGLTDRPGNHTHCSECKGGGGLGGREGHTHTHAAPK
jgi:hypothetical protein